MTASKEGTVKLAVRTGKKVCIFMLTNVLFVPEPKFNLFSVSKAAEAGKKTVIDKDGCKFVDISTNVTVGSAAKTGNLYYLNCSDSKNLNVSVNEKDVLWAMAPSVWPHEYRKFAKIE